MGNRNLESLSQYPDLAKSIAARTNLIQVYGYHTGDRSKFDYGNQIQAEIRDTGSSEQFVEILEPLGELVTNLPSTLTPDEQLDLKSLAKLLESQIGGMHLLPVVLTWVMREPVRKGEISLGLMQKRPAQPKTLAQTLRDLADSLDGGITPSVQQNKNILPFRKSITNYPEQ